MVLLLELLDLLIFLSKGDDLLYIMSHSRLMQAHGHDVN